MMLFDSSHVGGMKDERRAMAMPCWGGPGSDLGMAFNQIHGQGAVSSFPIRRCPVQLDLLPMHPPSQHSASASAAPTNSSFTQISHHHPLPPSHLNSKDEDGVRVVEIRGCSPRGGGIDMNQLPSSDYDDADVSSPNSILSPFHATQAAAVKPANVLQVYPKRERERSFTEFEQEADRGCEATSRASDDEDAGMPRKKLRLSKEQSALLEESFKEHSTLNPKQKSALAKQLNLRPRQVEVWFQNRRARTKLKQTEIDCELLKRCCESLTEENRRLQKELQELRAIKLPPPCIIAPDFFMPFPAATLTMCPSCERVAPVESAARSTQLLHLPKSAAAAHPPAFTHFSKAAAAASTH